MSVRADEGARTGSPKEVIALPKGNRASEQPNKMPAQPTDCREALHWFVENIGLYSGSVRGLLASDFSAPQEPFLESAIINLKSRGMAPLVIEGQALYKQAGFLWEQALRGTSFGRPVATKFELELTGSDLLILQNLVAPKTPQELWYLYHHTLYPRALSGKATLITVPVDYWEFVGSGANCDDLEYAGRRITWEKLLWLLDATAIDLHHFAQVKSEGLSPMLKAEYYLYKTLQERNMNVVPQHVIGDYMLDFALVEKNNKIDIECDVISTLDGSGGHTGEAKRNLVLLSDGWKVLRFTNSELLSNVVVCADAVEEVWQNGRKKSSFGRLISGQSNVTPPEPPVDDDVQRLAIAHGAGPCAITGGAGSGKSTCIAYRVAYLLSQGINPDNLLVISYSKETLKSLRTMIEELTDRQLSQRINFFAWHDLGLKILKENVSAIKRKPPLKVEQSSQKVIQRLLAKHKKDLDPLTLELSEDLDEFTLASLISLYKANLVQPKHVKERSKGEIDELVAKVYQAYEDQLQKANRVDRDDMIALAALVLVDQPEVRARYQYQYEYVLVDEYQDATAACDLLARLLALPQDNLYIAGDEDETIWECRGSLPRLLPEVSLRLPNARCYLLEKNWRCHPVIVDHARRIIRYLERRRMQKDIISGWGAAPTSAIIGPQVLPDEVAETEWVADEMQILIDSGRQASDAVILYRHNRYAMLVEEALTRRGIRCLATHPEAGLVPDEVGDVMAFLKLVMDPDGPKARESFERVCQLRVKEVDPKLSATIASFAEANNLSYLKAVEIYSEAVAEQSCRDLEQLVRIIRTMNQENLPPAETISLLRRTQRLNEYYRSIKVPPGVNYEPLRKLTQLEEEARQYKVVADFVKAHGAKQHDKGGEGTEGAVSVLSVNETKGQEFPVVFLVGMADGLFPSDASADLEEERRLFYVAITRARELLYLSYPVQFSGTELIPSLFLDEAGLLSNQPYVPPQAATAATPVAKQPAVPVQAACAPPPQPGKIAQQNAPAQSAPLPVKQSPPSVTPQPVPQSAGAAAPGPVPPAPPQMVPPAVVQQPAAYAPQQGIQPPGDKQANRQPPAPLPQAPGVPHSQAPQAPIQQTPASQAAQAIPQSQAAQAATQKQALVPQQSQPSTAASPLSQAAPIPLHFATHSLPAAAGTGHDPAADISEAAAPAAKNVAPVADTVGIGGSQGIHPALPPQPSEVAEELRRSVHSAEKSAVPGPALPPVSSGPPPPPMAEPLFRSSGPEVGGAHEPAEKQATGSKPSSDVKGETWTHKAADLQNEAVPQGPAKAAEAGKEAGPAEPASKKKKREYDARLPNSAHDMLVGDNTQSGSGDAHRMSWMEDGVPNLGIPVPQEAEAKQKPDVGAPVAKRSQTESPPSQAWGPVEYEPEAGTQQKTEAQKGTSEPATAVYNALDSGSPFPGLGALPALPEDLGRKGKRSNVSWGSVSGGIGSSGRGKGEPAQPAHPAQPSQTSQAHQPPSEEPINEAAQPQVPTSPYSSQQQPVQYQELVSEPPPQQLLPATPYSSPQAPYQVPYIEEGTEHLPRCPQCHAKLDASSNFCGECGYKLEVRIPACPSCACPLEPSAKFCGECGAKISPSQNNGGIHGMEAEQARADQVMKDYLSGYGPNQTDKKWVNKLKKILD